MYIQNYEPFVIQVPLQEDEVLKEIITHNTQERYFISNYGALYSLARYKWKEKVLQIDTSGYYYADIYNNGERERVRIHQLVAEYFLENDAPKEKVIVHHRDGNKLNNYYKNLVYCSLEEHTELHRQLRMQQDNETL